MRRSQLVFTVAALAASVALAAAPATPSSGAREERYQVLTFGKPSGSEVCKAAAGKLVCDYEFNDRGRGPKLHEELELAADGTPSRVTISGNDYLKAPVTETFTRDAAHAAWKNQGEQGEAPGSGPAFYWPFNSLPTDAGWLGLALSRGAGGSLALLPAGEVRLEKLGERSVGSGAATRKVTQVAVSGLGFSPYRFWVDEGGLFADTGGGWFSVVRQGYESALPDLLKADREAESAHFANLAKTLEHKPTGPVAIRGVWLFNPATGKTTGGTTILISGNRIQAVGPDATISIPAGAQIVDGQNKFVLPGMWDMHTHLGADDGALHIAAGVTSVRDMANDIDLLTALKKSWDEGSAVGPRVHRAGFMDSPGPYAGPTKVLVDNEKDAVAWVDKYADLGYEQIKIYSSMKPELVPPIIAEAHKRGLRVSGHIPAFMTAEQCVKLGFDEIQHANFLFLNFWPKEVPDTRTPARFHAIGERAAALDLQSKPVLDFLHLLHDRHTVSDPTLVTFEGMFQGKAGSIDPSFAAIEDRLPPSVRRGMLGGGLQAPAGKEESYRQGFTAMQNMVMALYSNGVPIVAGTDSLAGFAYHRELELYANAGIPAAAVLRIATIDAARIMKSDKDLGTIEPGKLADLVMIDGDPLVHMRDIRNVRLVVKDGVLFAPAEIDRAIGVKP
jgi:hypothetical protein